MHVYAHSYFYGAPYVTYMTLTGPIETGISFLFVNICIDIHVHNAPLLQRIRNFFEAVQFLRSLRAEWIVDSV